MSIDRLDVNGIGPFRMAQSIRFTSLTFLVGNNGTGKSTILRSIDAFRKLAEAPIARLVIVDLPPSQSADVCSLGWIKGTSLYRFSLRAADAVVLKEELYHSGDVLVLGEGTGHFTRENSHTRDLEPELPSTRTVFLAPTYQAYFASDFWSGFSSVVTLDPDPKSIAHGYEMGRVEDRGGLAALLYAQSSLEVQRRIEETLRVMQPDLLKIHSYDSGGRAHITVTTENHSERQPSVMSDGFLRAFAIVTALRTLPDGTLLLLEEPETSLHFDALSVLSDEMLFASRRMQIVATTHSPELLSNGRITADMIRTLRPGREGTVVGELPRAVGELLDARKTSAGELLSSGMMTEAIVE